MKLLTRLADQSVLLLGLVAALCAALGANEAWTKVATAGVPLLLALLVNQVTSSPTTVTEVARQTAESLSAPAAGAAGTITQEGEDVVNTVVGGVGGLVGKLAPKVGGS